MKNIFVLIILSCLGCSVAQQNNNAFVIQGTWRFESCNFIGTSDNFSFSDDGQGSLYVLFGSEILMNCVGKDIQFLDEGMLTTNLTNQEPLEAMNFKYNMQLKDSLIIFSVRNPNDSSLYNMPVKFSAEEDKMIWNIDQLFEIVLKRSSS